MYNKLAVIAAATCQIVLTKEHDLDASYNKYRRYREAVNITRNEGIVIYDRIY